MQQFLTHPKEKSPLERGLFLHFALFFAVLVAVTLALLARGCFARSAGRASDALFSFAFCSDDVGGSGADHQNDHGDYNDIGHLVTFVLSAFISFFVFRMMTVKTAAMAPTIAQPRIGIQSLPKLPPVKSVPKKNTRKPTE
jgi:hypothetical protein